QRLLIVVLHDQGVALVEPAVQPAESVSPGLHFQTEIATAERQNDIVTGLIDAADLRSRESVDLQYLGNGPFGEGAFVTGSAAAHVGAPPRETFAAAI